MSLSLLLLVVLAGCAAAADKSLPPSWARCRRFDPDLRTCLPKATNGAVKDLTSIGAREFGIFPIDPLRISKLSLVQGTGPVAIDLHFEDIELTGLKVARVGKVININLDPDHFQLDSTVEPPLALDFTGKYRVKGKVLLLPVYGEGRANFHFKNANCSTLLRGKKKMKNGKLYIDISEFKFTIEPERFSLYMENLFGGNKQLGEQMNKFLNENSDLLFKEMVPTIQDAFGAAFADMSNRIFSKVPYDQIFLK